ncbi:MAG: response regulator [Planctomycetota bacterium]|nr:response regulator [Planctomycetota bacterium]
MPNDGAVVHVVDDDPAMLESIKHLVESVHLPVQTYGSAREFLDAFDPTTFGCVIVDVRMPNLSGLDLQESLKEQGVGIPVIVLTGFADVAMAVRAMKNGAIDFIEKPAGDQVLLDVIYRAIEFDRKLRQSRQMSNEVAARFERLTTREQEVLEYVVEGLSSKEIADRLHVSFKTIEAHRSKIMKKTEANSLPHLVRMNLGLNPAKLRAQSLK